MKRIVNTNIRFNLNREDDRQAYEYLRHLDRKQYKSYTRAVVAALNDSFSRQERKRADPFLETREKEDQFLRQVLDTVREGILEGMRMIPISVKDQPVENAPKPDETGNHGDDFEIAEAFLKDMGL